MNKKIRVGTLEEKKVVLLLIYCELEIALAQCTNDGNLYGTGLTEHKLFRQTSATLQMDWKEVRWLYYYFNSKETGQTLDSIRPVYNNSLRGKYIPNSKSHGKIPNSLRLNIIKYIYTKHAKVKKVACGEILNWLQKKHAIYYVVSTPFRELCLTPAYPTIQANQKCTTITLHILTKSETTWSLCMRF